MNWLNRIFGIRQKQPSQPRLYLTLRKQFYPLSELLHMSTPIKPGESIVLKIETDDANGNPLTDTSGNPLALDGIVKWDFPSSLGTLVVSDDTLSATFTAGAEIGVGVATITATADADLSPAVNTLTAVYALQVIGSEAAAIKINAGAPFDALANTTGTDTANTGTTTDPATGAVTGATTDPATGTATGAAA
jgi:hypothetical protein